MRSSLLLAVVLLALSYVTEAQEQTFVITTVGTFRQTEQYGLPTCPYCNCPTSCRWIDNFACNATAGPDDNQQRWASCSSRFGCPCFNQSGVGFQGVTNLPVVVNSGRGSRVGVMTHYNNEVRGDSPSVMRLVIQVSSPDFDRALVISTQLNFVETDNDPPCDPSIQESDVPCDDRFSFNVINDKKTFQSENNKQYELTVNGFVKEEGTEPIRDFVTVESKTNKAEIYVTIGVVCADSTCGPFETPRGLPQCDCLCNLDSETCKSALGSDWFMPPDNCECECDPSKQCPSGQQLNTATCSCGCDVKIDDESCAAQNPLFEASTTECGCACNRVAQINCFKQNMFYRALTNQSCGCGCAITDAMCADEYGEGYVVDKDLDCGCTKPSGDGDGDGSPDPGTGGWIGICIGIVVFIAFIFGIIAAVFFVLIKFGFIPGVFGYAAIP